MRWLVGFVEVEYVIPDARVEGSSVFVPFRVKRANRIHAELDLYPERQHRKRSIDQKSPRCCLLLLGQERNWIANDAEGVQDPHDVWEPVLDQPDADFWKDVQAEDVGHTQVKAR